MTDSLHRLTYDATIDDAVDVSLRLANRTKAFRNQFRNTVVVVGIIGALVLIIAWTLYSRRGIVWGSELLLELAVAAVSGVAFAFVFRGFFIKEIRRQHRKMMLEQFGGKTTIPTELEVRPSAIWVRQAGMEMLFPWSVCTGVQDNPHDIQIDFAPGVAIVRDRHFSSPGERQAFLETVKRLAGSRSG